MKKIDIIVCPEEFEDFKEMLYGEGVESMTVSGIIEQTKIGRGYPKKPGNLTFRFKIEVVVQDDIAQKIVYAVKNTAKAGNLRDDEIIKYKIHGMDGYTFRSGYFA